MHKFWSVLRFIGQVIALAVASFAGASISGCMFAF